MDNQDNSAMDYTEHNKTYALFLSLSKVVTIVAVVVISGMALFLL